MEAKERTSDSKAKPRKVKDDSLGPERERQVDSGSGEDGIRNRLAQQSKDPSESGLLQDRAGIVKGKDHARLTLSGSRSRLARLKPNGNKKNSPVKNKTESSDNPSEDDNNSSDASDSHDDEFSKNSSDASVVDDFDRSTTPGSKTSPFRSILAKGGGSSSAAALALKAKLGRMPKFNFQERARAMSVSRVQRGDASGGGWGGKKISRPPIQHSDSLDSDEGTKGSGERSAASEDATSVSLDGNDLSSVQSDERSATSGDEEGSGELRRDHRGVSPSSQATGETNHHASQLGDRLRRLKPTVRGLRWSNKNKNELADITPDREDRRRLSGGAKSPSSGSTTSDDPQGEQEGPTRAFGSPGSTAGALSAADNGSDEASLLNRKQESNERNGRRRFDKGGKRRGPPVSGTATAIGVSASSSGSGVPLLEKILHPWRVLRGWGDLDEVEHPAVATVSGVGRPAAGALENALYGWFGRVAARTWPGVGLAQPPELDGRDDVKMRARVRPNRAALEDDAIQITVLGTDALPEDSRITRPMIVVHIVDSSTGRYLTKTPPPKGWASTAGEDRPPSPSATHSKKNGERWSERPPFDTPDGKSRDAGTAAGANLAERVAGSRQPKREISPGLLAVARQPTPISGSATATFEERTLWDITGPAGGAPETGKPCETVPPVATQPWIITMRSATPAWEEAFVFAESYRRMFAPETMLLFELVDFAAALSRKEARKTRWILLVKIPTPVAVHALQKSPSEPNMKGGGLSKIAWGFLRPIGAGGECNVGVRNRDGPLLSSNTEPMGRTNVGGKAEGTTGGKAIEIDSGNARTSTLQLFEHQPLTVLARWQARQRGFPRLAPPASPDVPDVFLQFLLLKRKRYPATLSVSVGPTPRPRPVWVLRRPRASHEREGHQLSYEALAVMHEKSREDRKQDEAAGIITGTGGAGVGGAGACAAAASTARAERAWAARARRLRGKTEPCVLPDRLLHRVYAGQNGAITIAFSGSGALLAAACCDDPLPGRFPIRLIDSETGRCRHELRGHASMVYSLVWSPGDSLLLSASADGTAKVWRISSASGDQEGIGEGIAHLGEGLISTKGVAATERRGGKDENPGLVCVLQHAPPCFVYAAVFQPTVLDTTRGTPIALDKPTSSEASECALVVTGAYDRQLRLWDVSAASVSPGGQAKMLGTLANKVVHESHVNAVVYDTKNGRLYSGDGVGAIVVWRRANGGQGRGEDYSVLRKVQHADLIGKAITSLALAPRLRRGQLLVQAHGNTLRLLDLGTYQLVNPGFAGGATTGSLVRAFFSPDGHFVVSGSEKGQVCVWQAQEGKRVRTPLQTLGTACCLRDVAWHPHQHVIALAGYGQDTPVLLYCGEARADKQAKGEGDALQASSAMEEEAAREAQASAEEHRRRLDNRQRLRELRIKRLRAKALGFVEGAPDNEGDGRPKRGVVAALAALTAEGNKEKAGEERGENVPSAAAIEAAGVASTAGSAVPERNRDNPKYQLSGA